MALTPMAPVPGKHRHPRVGAYDHLPLVDRQATEEYAPPNVGRPYFTLTMIALCVVVMFLELLANGRGVDPGAGPTDECYYQLAVRRRTLCAASFSRNLFVGPSNAVLVDLGARQGKAIITHGEWWRLFVPIFLHGGVVHLFVNMLSLSQFTRMECMHGSVGVGIIYVLAGVFGNIMGTALAPRTISVGASGAIFGLIGASVGEIIQNWSLYPEPCCVLLQLSLGAAFQLLLGTMPMVDNFAHFFGCCMGFLSSLGLLVLPRHNRSGRRLSIKWYQLLVQFAATACVPLAFAAGLAVLYGKLDMHEGCPWCDRISCIPFPWGCNQSQSSSCWGWDCSTCQSGGLVAKTYWAGTRLNGTVVLSCPDVRQSTGHLHDVTVHPVDLSTFRNSTLLDMCKGHCPDAFL